MSTALQAPVRATWLLVALLAGCGGGGGGGGDAAAPAPVAAPSITAQPQAASVLTDAPATFTVTATGAGLSYQWLRNGAPIPGATASSYTTGAASYQDHGANYSVTVSNGGGSVNSATAQLSLKLSTNQQAFEDLILAPNGSHMMIWNLNYSGAETSGVNYAATDFAVLSQSPLTHGPQTNQQSARTNLAPTLPIPTLTPTRILRGGAILVVPTEQAWQRVSYVGSDVRIDSLASDGTTVAFSQTRTSYVTVALAGVLAGSTDDFAHYHNSFYSNPAILSASATYLPGAAYLKYTAINSGDRYNAFDCVAVTNGANISPCRTGTTLAAELTAGIASSSDGVTYHQADGVTSTVGGVAVWVASNPRPLSATLSSTVQYRVYFEMNGNVYTGALIKDGQVLGGSYYVSNPGAPAITDRLTFLPFNLRMNKAARDSIAAALAI
jgi:hypothetical protein